MKILKSLVIVIAMVAMVAGATTSVFTSQASVIGNTFATGTLEIRIDGQASISGFTLTNAIPGSSQNGSFSLQNYGAPWFGGPSTLPAKHLKISAVKTAGDDALWNVLTIDGYSTVGWNPNEWHGLLKNFTDKEILLSGNELPTGWSMPMSYTVTLPIGADNSLMGKTVTFDFVVTAYSS